MSGVEWGWRSTTRAPVRKGATGRRLRGHHDIWQIHLYRLRRTEWVSGVVGPRSWASIRNAKASRLGGLKRPMQPSNAPFTNDSRSRYSDDGAIPPRRVPPPIRRRKECVRAPYRSPYTWSVEVLQVYTPPGTRTPNLLIKRTLHTHAHGCNWLHRKEIGKPAPSVDATECPQNAARRHDMRHDTSHPLPGGHAKRAA